MHSLYHLREIVDGSHPRVYYSKNVRYRIIGASMSKPHTSVFKCVIHYYSVVRHSVNQRTLF